MSHRCKCRPEATRQALVLQSETTAYLRTLCNWLKEWRQNAIPLLRGVTVRPDISVLAQAQAANLIMAQFDGHSTYRDLLEMASAFDLGQGIELIRESGQWIIVSAWQGTLTKDGKFAEVGDLKDEDIVRFPTPDAALHYVATLGIPDGVAR